MTYGVVTRVAFAFHNLTKGVTDEKHFPIPICGAYPIHYYESIACTMALAKPITRR
jgi:hypothetical protein